MLSQVTTKHPFLLHLPLLRLLWAGLHQGTKEGDELAAFLWRCTTKWRNQVIPGLAQLDEAEHNTFDTSKREEHYQQVHTKTDFPHPPSLEETKARMYGAMGRLV